MAHEDSLAAVIGRGVRPVGGGRAAGAGSVAEVFAAFLKLGLTSFGGPIAHLGYFQRELIERRRWVDEAHYVQLVALCQLLPGPASSQLGFALGLIRAGWLGAIAAFVAFTLPSALLLFAFAHVLPLLAQPDGQAAIHGLKLVAVAVVAQGVLLMAKRLTPDAPRALIAAGAGALVAIGGSTSMQLAVVVAAAVLGLVFCRNLSSAAPASFPLRYGPRTAVVLFGAFTLLLVASIGAEHAHAPYVAAAAAFYRTGALVFGGGHVVLPLLQQAVVVPGWVPQGDFLAGYGAAQAVPGPMFTIAGFLGARLEGGQGGLVGATVALLAIFLPGFLLVASALPLWQNIASRAGSLSALAGVNAAVVGILAAALYDPVWTGAVLTPADFATALVAFVLLTATRTPGLVVVAACVLASLGRVWMEGAGS
jgi:chromate transporter